MRVNRRTQEERSTTTRAALLAAARPLFAAQGFGAVGTEAIVRAAGVTRGALYHQFADKTGLFAAVYEQVQQELALRIAGQLGGVTDPAEALLAGIDAWLEAATEPDVQRIVLIEAPAVLGWERWRDAGQASAIGLVEAVLGAAIAAGSIVEQPLRPLAHVLIGALDEAALYIARADDADDADAAREQMRTVLRALLSGLEPSEPGDGRG
ncbi:TetR/AcrR family transcriptional regulator [Conexibacter sp. JD483]|uniref:TetR/AcrR family transcriptional regulator n=1 Tax=unclassified Conexibacter TaxID=2627773 RepID=UPI00271AF713|nr:MULTISPECIES: TetR/AcrR family transcriptional regulator [unclassified Conexibacter]MDO8185213.1 TetR/AcrR family transcriptional regulator [Conexibacter sp. CPCC 205706]MDO8198259.1 TetR/AcrR family transcriptional regulator [Conexibacter sp. CPCC 205762]MDR9367779.1 TetR/AcrR family transcriptional regulator [Conexibacter sp. JD483]